MANILTERRGRVLLVTLNRPESLNALIHGMGGLLRDAINAAAADSEIGAVVVTGAGTAFSAGGDLGWIAEQVGGVAYMIEGAGHYPHAEMPAEAASVILPFVNRVLHGKQRGA